MTDHPRWTRSGRRGSAESSPFLGAVAAQRSEGPQSPPPSRGRWPRSGRRGPAESSPFQGEVAAQRSEGPQSPPPSRGGGRAAVGGSAESSPFQGEVAAQRSEGARSAPPSLRQAGVSTMSVRPAAAPSVSLRSTPPPERGRTVCSTGFAAKLRESVRELVNHHATAELRLKPARRPARAVRGGAKRQGDATARGLRPSSASQSANW